MRRPRPRVAIVHEWLVTYGGSERVVAELLRVFPDADLFAIIDTLTDADREQLGGRHAKTTYLQRVPGGRRVYKALLPIMPHAIEQLDLRDYDIVISSSHAVAKGVLTGPDQLHIAYVYTPMRYAWDLQHAYLETGAWALPGARTAASAMLHRLRLWDFASAQRPDHLVAISSFVARRIGKYYGREATVIHPPVDVDRFVPGGERKGYYVTASRLVAYKGVDRIVSAFAGDERRKLVVIGDGPERSRIEALAGPNVEVRGHVPFEELRRHLQEAAAFLYAGVEDFGIAPVEAQACGTPVIAFARGGVLDTVRDDPAARTGVLFPDPTPDGIRAAVDRFESLHGEIDDERVRSNALNFSGDRFRSEIATYVHEAWEAFEMAVRSTRNTPR